ncbi:hypothetical protein GUJ93_ZPchr0005g15957 [Zizania palustris]|uniref:Uncharacterized protein n=1 Tax=Zizania palustris TaxID=103762 RepID=A0A8J5VR46_ZIZPA|nr:hypothetical protein GUJ93_ZPchr0005g15957 [Zizania palustris]
MYLQAGFDSSPLSFAILGSDSIKPESNRRRRRNSRSGRRVGAKRQRAAAGATVKCGRASCGLPSRHQEPRRRAGGRWGAAAQAPCGGQWRLRCAAAMAHRARAQVEAARGMHDDWPDWARPRGRPGGPARA